MRKPDFFILGAAKCGTTSLWYYLSQHPEIYMCRPKEPGFFVRGKKTVSEPADYFSLFDAAGDRRLAGDATTGYFSCAETPGLIRLLCPDAKFIVTVRHPADRAYSLYHFMRSVGFEFASTFEEALDLESSRVSDQRFQQDWPIYLGACLYFRSGLFGEQADRYLGLMERRRFYFLTLDRLKREPVAVLREIFAFLGVAADFIPPDLSRKYTSLFTSRNAPLHHWWRRHIWKNLPRAREYWPLTALHRLEWKYNIRSIPPINAETRRKLCDDYRQDLGLFSRLTGLQVDPDGRW